MDQFFSTNPLRQHAKVRVVISHTRDQIWPLLPPVDRMFRAGLRALVKMPFVQASPFAALGPVVACNAVWIRHYFCIGRRLANHRGVDAAALPSGVRLGVLGYSR